jgi:hypothetical protein
MHIDTIRMGTLIVVLVIVAGFVWVRWVLKRMKGVYDKNTGPFQRRHPILGNPIFWVYVATTIVLLSVVAWAMTTMSYEGGHHLG